MSSPILSMYEYENELKMTPKIADDFGIDI